MVTGDHHLTATAIAKQIGILTGGVDEFIHEAEDVIQIEEIEPKTCKPVDRYQVLVDRISRTSMSFLPKEMQLGAVVTGEYITSATND